MRRILLSLLFVATVAPAVGAPKKSADPEEDPLVLAEVLLRDEHFDRADRVLDAIDPASEGLDVAHFWTLRGLVDFALQDWPAAATAFQKALDHGETDAIIRVYLGQSLLSDGKPAEAARVLDHPSVEPLAAAWLVRARALWDSKQLEAAWVVLDEGASRFPDRKEFGLQRTLLLIDLGLYQEARRQGVALLAQWEAEPKTWALIGDALRRAGHPTEAVQLLEEAKIRFPGELDILVPLAHAWLAAEHPMAAGLVLQEAAVLDNKYAQESAEMYRRAGVTDRALTMNALVQDSKERTQQRLGLLLEREEFEKALALGDRIERLGLSKDDTVRYGVAYAAFRSGDVHEAERWLAGIRDATVFRNANQLREAMAACSEGGCF